MNNNINDICSVCLDAYKDPTIQSCGHIYCRLCIVELIKHRQHYNHIKCPLCRRIMTSNERRGIIIPNKYELLYCKVFDKNNEEDMIIIQNEFVKNIIRNNNISNIKNFLFLIIFIIIGVYFFDKFYKPWICTYYPWFDKKICYCKNNYN